MDVLAHELMPAVDSPQPGGLTDEELATLLIPLLQSGQVVGLDLRRAVGLFHTQA